MCPGTFISLIFIRDLGMALYLGGGWGDKSKHKGIVYSKKKVIRLIIGIKNMNPADRNLRKLEFLQ